LAVALLLPAIYQAMAMAVISVASNFVPLTDYCFEGLAFARPAIAALPALPLDVPENFNI